MLQPCRSMSHCLEHIRGLIGHLLLWMLLKRTAAARWLLLLLLTMKNMKLPSCCHPRLTAAVAAAAVNRPSRPTPCWSLTANCSTSPTSSSSSSNQGMLCQLPCSARCAWCCSSWAVKCTPCGWQACWRPTSGEASRRWCWSSPASVAFPSAVYGKGGVW